MKKHSLFLGFAVLFTAAMILVTSCDDGSSKTDDPALTGTVSITGTAKVGQILTVVTAELNTQTGLHYQWKRGTANAGADQATYMLTAGDAGNTLTVTVSADGFSGSVTSGATGRIANPIPVTPNPGESVADALTRVLSGAAGGASAEEPVAIALSGDAVAALATGSDDTADALGALYAALDGKYVSLDLSACTDTSIGNTTSWEVVDARPNKDKLVSVILPESLTTIGNYAFSGCSGLTAITLPESLTTIGNYAFSGCNGLTAITLPAGLTAIGNWAFVDCSGLMAITLPAGLTTIEFRAFSGCSRLTAITLPASLTTIGNLAFFGCTGLTTVTANRATPPTLGSGVFNRPVLER